MPQTKSEAKIPDAVLLNKIDVNMVDFGCISSVVFTKYYCLVYFVLLHLQVN